MICFTTNKAVRLPEKLEILGDFIALARGAERDGQHEVAAVYLCAALENSLKQWAKGYVRDVHDKELPVVVHAQRNAPDVLDITPNQK